jgi:hypothetical protein
MFKEFLAEKIEKSECEILELYECKDTGFTKAVIKLSSRHTIEKYISDIVVDNNFLEAFDKKTIRTLTYMATVERLKPDCSVIGQMIGDAADDYTLQIHSRTDHKRIDKSLAEIVNDKSLLSRLSPIDANRIGYLAGIKDAVDEFKIKYKMK